MEANKAVNQSNNTFKIILSISFIVLAFWIVVQNINVYRYAVVGAIFEILWMPMIAVLFLVPFVSFYFWYKDQFRFSSKFFYLLLPYLAILTFIVLS